MMTVTALAAGAALGVALLYVLTRVRGWRRDTELEWDPY
jgi:hypothetical protein